MFSSHKFKIAIIVALLALLLIISMYFFIIKPRQCFAWSYYGVVVKRTEIPGADSIKDPEFVRFPNHTVFRDEEGWYYVIVSIFKSSGTKSTGILRTKTLFNYTFVGYMPQNLNGKIAPYCLHNSDDGKFYLFYSDWDNIAEYDINYSRLGLAVGVSIKNPSTFEDLGYLVIDGSPLFETNLGWDPYVVKIADTYYLLISAARQGVHLATSKTLGMIWNYSKIVTNETLENPALFYYNSKWYMMLGIYNGTGYDLYSSDDFVNWEFKGWNWFKDGNYTILPAGSSVIIVNDTLYHLYQIPLYQYSDFGPYELSLASIKLSDICQS